jgi:hypothetical protein
LQVPLESLLEVGLTFTKGAVRRLELGVKTGIDKLLGGAEGLALRGLVLGRCVLEDFCVFRGAYGFESGDDLGKAGCSLVLEIL